MKSAALALAIAVVTALAGCSSRTSTVDVNIDPDTASARATSDHDHLAPAPSSPVHARTVLLDIDYATWGLMPFPRCGTPTYRIHLKADRTFACGWESACAPYSERAPLRAKPAGTLDPEQVERLAELAGAEAFFALKDFNSNIHIIDGGEQQLDVHVGERNKKVEMANMSAPAFDELREALEKETGCSMATAGPEPR